MRIPNTAEFLALFVSAGQLTGLSNQRKIDIILFYDQYAADTRRFLFHIAVADLEALAGPDEPPCIQRFPPYIVQAGDTCNSIALRSPRYFPTLVSL